MSDTTNTLLSVQASPKSEISMINSGRIMIGGVEYIVEEQITKTVLVQRDNQPLAVEFKSLIVESEIQEGVTKDGKVKMNAARIADVIDLVTGQLHVLIMNTVLEKELTAKFPGKDGAGLLGLRFAIKSARPIDADGKQKRYRVYDILKIGGKLSDPVIEERVASRETLGDIEKTHPEDFKNPSHKSGKK
jgi:hypothetical protein